jgi:dihydropyrimidinase
MKNPTLLRGGRVIHGDRIAREDVLFSDEIIVTVGNDLTPPPSAQIIDCSGKLIFPGVIDAHTHMGIPIKDGHSADDFASGSKTALHGGVTTIIDFTHLGHDQSLMDSVRDRQKLAESCLTDYSVHANISRSEPQLLEEISDVLREGINSIKVFTTYREAGLMLDYHQIEKVATAVADEHGVLLVHAEDDEIIQAARTQLDPASTDPFLHGQSRPAKAEAAAVHQLGLISQRTGCHIYIVHLSSKAGLEAAREYENLFLETCPQYLFHTEDAYHRTDGAMYVASPPLHQERDCQALLASLGDGISVLATDHCPFHRIDKPDNLPYGRIPNGMGGVETLLPVILAHFIQGEMDLTILARVMAENPAIIFGFSGQKGKIEPGYDADLCVIDPTSITEQWFDQRVSITDWDAYTGMPALFPEAVWRRGEAAVINGVLQQITNGRFVEASS